MARTVSADQLLQVLKRFGEGKTVLSLDCFDTLIWRTTHAASDLFSDLDCGARVRAWSESLQRQYNYVARGSTEVSLREIHARAYPRADADELTGRVNDELLAEHSLCFGFAPTVSLMRAARARGMRIVVVSDTYLDEAQLRALIAHAAGASVLAMIDQVFCSSV
jgi:FMN phosphatase YigB (HAD superfamily)